MRGFSVPSFSSRFFFELTLPLLTIIINISKDKTTIFVQSLNNEKSNQHFYHFNHSITTDNANA